MLVTDGNIKRMIKLKMAIRRKNAICICNKDLRKYFFMDLFSTWFNTIIIFEALKIAYYNIWILSNNDFDWFRIICFLPFLLANESHISKKTTHSFYFKWRHIRVQATLFKQTYESFSWMKQQRPSIFYFLLLGGHRLIFGCCCFRFTFIKLTCIMK